MRARRVGFRGRTSEFDELTSMLGRAAAGAAFAVTIEGEAGIGKSRLIEEATQDVRGLRVLRGKASELERERPFGPLLDALGLRGLDVARLAPGDDVSAQQFAIADHFLDLLEGVSADGPVALVVEDVHRGDPATVSFLARLARQRLPLNTSLLCSRRPSPRSETLEALLRVLDDEGGTELRLGPLCDAAVDDLVSEMLGTRPGPALFARVRGAAGNPVYVIEYIEGLNGEFTRHDGTADVPDRSRLRPCGPAA